ncbi:conjugal transfer protein [Streptomyces lavendulae]|nr:conjugal transfer protein [Streptomyces lavendulae]TXJ73286.1 conjugal transfer protein [Streptomyces lavendulae]
MTSTITRRELTKGQASVLIAAAVVMAGVGSFGAWGTYSNVVSEFHRAATAAGVVAAGEGLTLILALTMLGLTMLGQAAPAAIRAGLWLAPVTACFTGLAIADDATESAVYALTPLAMSGAAEGLGLIARRIVVYRTGRDAEVDRRNAHVVQQLAYQQALAAGHPDESVQQDAERKAWKLIGRVGVGDPGLAEGLVDVSRTKLTAGAGHALDRMLALPPGDAPAARPAPRSASATDAVREHFADMDPVDAVRLAADARPDAGPVELATILGTYGVTVDPVAVALVLGEQAPEYTVDRPDATVAPQVAALPALSVQDTVEEAATALGPDATAREIAEHLKRTRRLVLPENHIRAALSRAAKKAEPEPDATPRNADMEGGYV